MATVIPAAQQVGGLVTVALVLIIGITLLVGGTAGGWFDGADSDKVSALGIMCNYVQPLGRCACLLQGVPLGPSISPSFSSVLFCSKAHDTSMRTWV